MSLHKILKDPECRGNIQCIIFGICVTFAWLCIVVYGFAWLSVVEKENAAFYGAKHLENRIKRLEEKEPYIIDTLDILAGHAYRHKHNYSTGLPFPYIKSNQNPQYAVP